MMSGLFTYWSQPSMLWLMATRAVCMDLTASSLSGSSAVVSLISFRYSLHSSIHCSPISSAAFPMGLDFIRVQMLISFLDYS